MSDKVSLGIVKCNAATPKALRVALNDGTVRWVPRSMVHDDSEVYENGHDGELVVSEWWADAEGLSDLGKGRKR